MKFFCKKGHINIIKYFIENKIQINKESLLSISYNFGQKNIVKYLIENGVNINKKNKRYISPLIIACKNNNEDLVKFLIEFEADVNKIVHNYTLLIHAKLDIVLL